MAPLKIKSGTPPVPCAQRLWSFLSLGGNFGGDVCFPIYGLAVVTVGSAPEKKQRQRAVIESTRTLQGAANNLCRHPTSSNANAVFAGPILLARPMPGRTQALRAGGNEAESWINRFVEFVKKAKGDPFISRSLWLECARPCGAAIAAPCSANRSI
jgi:hypothetical protein